MKRFLTFALPLFLLIPVAPVISLQLFQWREPFFKVPLNQDGPIQIRQDPYGSGLFGAPRSGKRQHRGLDLNAPIGTKVFASKSGRVFIGRLHNGMGRYVEIRHPDGWTTRYAHLKTISIQDNQLIRQGDAMGTVGKSGNARRRLIRPHLHFEVWNVEGIPVDPLTVMEIPEGTNP